jgi:hypothetical protein
MTLTVQGVRIPDSKRARAELARDTESSLLFHHSSRHQGRLLAFAP